MRSPVAPTRVLVGTTRTKTDNPRPGPRNDIRRGYFLLIWRSKQERYLALRDQSVKIEHGALELDEKAVRASRQQVAVPAHVCGGEPPLAAKRHEVRVDFDLPSRVAENPHIAVDMAHSRVRIFRMRLRFLQTNDPLLKALPVVRHEKQRFRRRQRSGLRVARRGDLVARVR